MLRSALATGPMVEGRCSSQRGLAGSVGAPGTRAPAPEYVSLRQVSVYSPRDTGQNVEYQPARPLELCSLSILALMPSKTLPLPDLDFAPCTVITLGS